MRALMTADTLGGVFTHALDLAAGLRGQDVEVVLATFGRRLTAEQRARVAAAGVERVIDTGLALEWMEDPWADVAAGQELLLELERREAPDIVHLNAYAAGAAPWRAPVLVAGHSCVLSWWQAVHGRPAPPDWERYRRAVAAGIAGADAVTAPSEAMLAELRRLYGPLPAGSRAIPNGSSYSGAATAPAKRPVVISAGRLWDEAKNVAALVEAARRPGLRGRVWLAGEGAVAGEDAVRWLGALAPADLARVRRPAAVYAAPARYEPFGLGILEAARDRCALVLGDIPSLREIWGDAAVYVDPGDAGRLGRVLEALLADPAGAARLGERARRRAARHTVAAMVAAYRSLYAGLVAGRTVVA